MFCARKIELHTRPDDLPTALISREMLVEHTHARQMLEQAEAQAQALINQAQAKCQQLLDNASSEFWQRANAQLHRWESERLAMAENLERVATSVINTTIRSLLDEAPPAQRISALLDKLLAAGLPPVEANLLCNPQDRESVELWLIQHCDVPWTLRVEAGLAAQSLIVETDDGGYHINWTDAVDSLVPIPPQGQIK
jgi:type III secretion protein L